MPNLVRSDRHGWRLARVIPDYAGIPRTVVLQASNLASALTQGAMFERSRVLLWVLLGIGVVVRKNRFDQFARSFVAISSAGWNVSTSALPDHHGDST